MLLTAQLLWCACAEEKSEPVGSCDDGRWAKVERNGEPICFAEITAAYNNPNASNSTINIDGGDGPNGATFSLYFKIPPSGLELNTTYQEVVQGDYFGIEEAISAQLVVHTYEAGVFQGASTTAAKITGTFSFTTENPNSKQQTIFTEGSFKQN